MQIFKSSNEVDLAGLPPATKAATLEAVKTLEEVFGLGFNSNECGYVALIEQGDTTETVMDHHGRLLFQMAIEGVFIRHDCLIAVTIEGNSGTGITWICPDVENVDAEVRRKLKDELAVTGGGQGGANQR